MEDFVADEQVQAKFLDVAQGRPGFGQQFSRDQCRTPLHVMINQSSITVALIIIVMFQLMAPWTLVILWREILSFSSLTRSRIIPPMYCTWYCQG